MKFFVIIIWNFHFFHQYECFKLFFCNMDMAIASGKFHLREKFFFFLLFKWICWNEISEKKIILVIWNMWFNLEIKMEKNQLRFRCSILLRVKHGKILLILNKLKLKIKSHATSNAILTSQPPNQHQQIINSYRTT